MDKTEAQYGKWLFWASFVLLCVGLGWWFDIKTGVIVFIIFTAIVHIVAAISHINKGEK